MRTLTLDLEALRSFVLGMELGNFAQAAERLNRSTSAVSAHLKKLESQIEQPIVQKVGRNLQLTPAGEELLSYGKRLLAINDDAVAALRRPKVSGVVRVGLQEDFGEAFLTTMLARFKRTNPEVTLDISVARNRELTSAFQCGKLDLALLWSCDAPLDQAEVIGRFPMQWIGSVEDLVDLAAAPLPLVVFESPCLMRHTAIEALDLEQRAWRIAMSSHSLAGIWAAVGAGLGITVRTPAGRPASLKVLDNCNLPELPSLNLCLIRQEQCSSAVVSFQEALQQELQQAFPDYLTI